MHAIFYILILLQSQIALQQGDLKSADYDVFFNQQQSTIQLFSKLTNELVTDEFTIDFFEVEIFDANDEYTGSLELQSLILPASEIEVFERMLISKAILRHNSGKKLIFLNKQIDKK